MKGTTSSWTVPFLQALPPYAGSKRRLLPAVLGLVDSVRPRQSWGGLTFADAFLGGGSIALTAKSLGFGKVVANDIAEQSALVGRGLLANSRVRLTLPLVLRLYEPAPVVNRQPPRLLDRLPAPHRHFLERAWRHLHGGSFAGVERDLVGLLLLKWISRYFPLGLPGATDAHRIVGGDFDSVTPQRLAHYLGRGRTLLQPSSLVAMARDINEGIIPGHAEFFQMDALAFLPAVEADIAYLDPPYPDTQSYERAFALVDEFLGQEPLPTSAFSSARPPLDELLDACSHIAVVVLSMNNALFSEGKLTALVASHRHVRQLAVLPYQHYAPLASPQKQMTNREILILSTRD